MKAISIKQPWAYLIASGIKDIENRTWKTSYRGKVLIHCSSTIDPRFKNDIHCFSPEQMDAIHKIMDVSDKDVRAKLFENKGAIIGEFDLVDCVVNHDSIWAEQSPEYTTKRANQDGFKPIHNWVIENAVLYDEPILNVKGKLSFWDFNGLIDV